MAVFIWLILFLLLASPVVYLAGRWGARTGRPAAARWTAMGAMLAAWGLFVATAEAYIARGPAKVTIGSVALAMDGVGLVVAMLALGLGTLVVFYSGPYMSAEPNREKYYAMLVAMVGIITGLGCATDLFNLWVWFEAMAISSYLLVAFYRDLPGSLEAGVKYLVQSAAGSALVLLGIGLVLAQTGTLDLAGIRSAATASPFYLAAGALFFIGFGVKVAMAPMHTWLPDAHSQAPSGISAMLSGVVIEAGLVALLRALSALGDMHASWGALLLVFGALNMFAGNLMALRQTQVKRLLAYSSLSHMGYMLVGLGAGIYAGTATGLAGGLFHMLAHGMMKGLAFLAAGALLYVLYIAKRDHHSPLTVDELSGAAQRYPWVAFALSLALLALGGLPPSAGFLSKWQIFLAGAATQDAFIMLIVIFAALNSVLSLAYYAPLVNRMYRKQPSEAVQAGKPVSMSMYTVMALLALGIVLVGLWPGLVTWLTEPAGAALLASFGF